MELRILNYFPFTRNMNRKNFTLITIIFYFIAFICYINNSSNPYQMQPGHVFSLLSLIPYSIICYKRLEFLNKSKSLVLITIIGILINFISLINIIFSIYLIFAKNKE